MRWTPCSDDATVATMAAEKAILCVLFEELSEPDEIGINMCLIMQNTPDVTVTSLTVQNKIENPNRVKGFVETIVLNYCDPTFASHFRMKRQTLSFVETVVLNYCDPTFASHFRMKRQTFQVKDNQLLTSETVLWSIWPMSIRLIIIADHCCRAMIL